MKRLSACIIALLLNSSLFILKGLADDVTITVQTPTTIEAGDQFRVRFTISSQNVSNFNAPDFKGFEVIYGPATSRQSSIQIINGRTTQSSSITYTYVLLGSKPGTDADSCYEVGTRSRCWGSSADSKQQFFFLRTFFEQNCR